ncbi:MAG: SusC/RagA family TonB-linked outer membrane protein [Salibacteraceae bacterium]
MFIGSVLAQRTVTGVVRSEDGETLPGATVLIKGTQQGTTTDMDGNYSIEVPSDETVLQFSFVGMETVEEKVGARSTIDVTLGVGKVLDEVVVTALNIPREKKALGYSTQTVDGEAVSRVKDVNFMSALSGQVAGAQIKNSGTMGGSANVIIRGYKSINGNNQPLYVVDGIPISNDITNSRNQRTGRGGYDYGNAAMDINPEDIESINVLKGAAATALYGARAANGVVLIVTKKGSKKKQGAGVTISSGVTFGQINKNTMPVYQKQYGPGYGQYYGPDTVFTGEVTNGYIEEVDTDGDGIVDALAVPMGEDASYGLEFDENRKYLTWESIYPELEETYLQPQPYVAGANDPTTFYETSVMVNNSVAVQGGNENGTYRVSFTDMQQKGVLPNSQLRRDNAYAALTFNLTDKLSVSTTTSVIQTTGLGRYGTGYDNRNVNQSFRQWYAVSTDMEKQKEAYERTGKNLTWNPLGFTFPEGVRERPHYFDNPYFIRHESYQNDQRNRLIGNMLANYKINDWLDVTGRITNDSYDEVREERIAVGSVDVPMYYKYTRTYYERNYDLFFTINKDLGADKKVNLYSTIGTNLRRQGSDETEAQTNGGLIVPGLYALANGVNGVIAPTFLPSTNDWKILNTPYERTWRRAVDGYYAQATLGYDKFLYLDLTGRYDISSTLPQGNNGFFYPAASVSFVYSELLDNSFLEFGKVRVNYAEVGNDAPVQSLEVVYNQNTPIYGVPLATAQGTNPNPNLLPENTRTIELGFENKFMDDRFGFDLTFYRANTFNQILPARVSSSTGTIFQYLNAGNIQNQGVELMLYADVLRTEDFTWNSKVNWALNRNQVVELADGLTTYQLASVQGGITIEAEVGQPYGVIKGTNFVYYNGDETKPIVYDHPFGGVRYAKTSSPEIIGNMLPDWTGGWTNTFTYKGLSLMALIDVQKGGQFFSLDTWYGYGTGIYDFTAGTNDKGNPVRDSPESGGGLPLGGVVAAKDANGNYIYDEDGNLTSDGTENTEYGWYGNYANSSGWATAPNALHIYDATYVKLRQVALTYNFPKSVIDKLPITGLQLSLIGRNLAILYKNSPYTDPEAGLSAGNVQGYQSGAYPSVREYGFNLTIKF